MADEFVAGHVIFGVGMMIAAYCINRSGIFRTFLLLIPKNASGRQSDGTPLQAYSSTIGNSLIAVPVLLTLFGFIWSVILLRSRYHTTLCCRSRTNGVARQFALVLLALSPLLSIKTRNTFSSERTLAVVLLGYLLGSLTIIFWYLRINQFGCKRRLAPALFSFCLGMICYSIFSKVWFVSAGMATHMFVSQQNTHDSGIYLSVLSVPCCVPAEIAPNRYYFIPCEFWWV